MAAMVGVFLCLTAACMPPELLESGNQLGDAGDGGRGDGGRTVQDAGGDTGGTDGRPTVDFSRIATLVTGSCAQGAICHGAGGTSNFTVEGGTAATAEQVRAAIEGVDTDNEPPPARPIVVPGEPAESALYLRLVTDDTIKKMPQTGSVTDDQINTVKTWIAEGANYE